MQPFRIWQRHLVLTSLLLLLALACTATAALRLPRTYEAGATVVLLASRNSSKALGDGNPYLSFSSSLSTTASVLDAEITDSQIALSLKERGLPDKYQVTSQSTLSQSTTLPTPFLIVSVTGSNKIQVEHTLHGVTGEIGSLLDGLQATVARNNRISLMTASFDPEATLSVTATARPLIAIFGVLIILALAVPALVDASVARNRASSRVDQASSATPTSWDSDSYSHNFASKGSAPHIRA